MDFEVVIPWFPALATPARSRALAYVLKRYSRAGLPATVAECPAERFSKASAVVPALRRSRASTVAVADADVWAEGDGVELGRQAVLAGKPWCKPYTLVHRLTEQGTKSYMQFQCKEELEQVPYIGIDGGGIVIGRRQDLLDVPLDKRFEGWGGEDESWGIALSVLLGPCHFLPNDLVHFWHEKPERETRQVGNKKNDALRRKYYSKEVLLSKEKMQRLVDCGKD